jgi:hypothetical protein
MPGKFKVPKFDNEADEARWWSDHRDDLTQAFQDAAAKFEVSRGSAAIAARREGAAPIGITPTTTIRLDPEDISRARTLAAKRGLRYQTYVKMLLHEALESEEKKLAG